MPPPVYGRPAVGTLSHLFVDHSGDLAQPPQDILPLAHESFGLWIGGRIERIHQHDSFFALSVVLETGENSTVRIDVTCPKLRNRRAAPFVQPRAQSG
jgi:hypothetical protein